MFTKVFRVWKHKTLLLVLLLVVALLPTILYFRLNKSLTAEERMDMNWVKSYMFTIDGDIWLKQNNQGRWEIEMLQPVETEKMAEARVEQSSQVHAISTLHNKSLTLDKHTGAALSGLKSLPKCPMPPPGLVGHLPVNFEAVSLEELHTKFGNISQKGPWQPKWCSAIYKVAIVVPYRDRDEHLRVFLNHMIPFLQKQLIEFKIFIIDEALPAKFNRGMLLNIGFVEAYKIWKSDCVIFHDVDLLPETDWTLYTCPKSIRHMSAYVDKFDYRLPYVYLIGGVTAMTPEIFKQLDGFSNRFFGWGGEDDDMFNRMYLKRLTVDRYSPMIARYKMIQHDRDKGNEADENRHFWLYENWKRGFQFDGLSTLEGTYSVAEINNNGLYTRVYVRINQDLVLDNLSKRTEQINNIGSFICINFILKYLTASLLLSYLIFS